MSYGPYSHLDTQNRTIELLEELDDERRKVYRHAENLQEDLGQKDRDNAALRTYLQKEIAETSKLEQFAKSRDEEAQALRMHMDKQEMEYRHAIDVHRLLKHDLTDANGALAKSERKVEALTRELKKREDELKTLVARFREESKDVRRTIKSLDMEKYIDRHGKIAAQGELLTTHETIDKLDEELKTTNERLEEKTAECEENLERAIKAEAEQKKIQELYDKCQDTIQSQAENIKDLTTQLKLKDIDLQHAREQSQALTSVLSRKDAHIVPPPTVVVDNELVAMLKASVAEKEINLEMALAEVSRLKHSEVKLLHLLQRSEEERERTSISHSPVQPPVSMRPLSLSPPPASPRDTHPGPRYVSAFLHRESQRESPLRQHLISPPSIP